MNTRFRSSLVELGGKDFCWMLYDLKERTIVEPLCDYADDLVRRCQLARLSVEQEMGYLRIFWAFLANTGKTLSGLSGSDIVEFRDFAFKQTVSASAHRGSEESAKASTNAKLARVYDWLRWLEDTGRVSVGYIGPKDCQILSGLQRSSVFASAKVTGQSLTKPYPALFRLKAGKSKHRLPKFLPDESTLDSVHAYFFRAHRSQYIAHRNALIATLAAYTGFRRASIQSLKVSQFEGGEGFPSANAYTMRETFIVQPIRQKFNYGSSFEVPIWLQEQVVEFVRTHRKKLIDDKRVPARVHDDYIFLSEKTGEPLDDRTFSALMSKAMRSVGASKGTAMHSWRAKFAIDETAEAYETRVELGLDTSISSMDVIVARRLGHKDVTSARPYTARHEAVEVARRRAERTSQAAQTRQRIAELEKETEELRRQLATKSSSPEK